MTWAYVYTPGVWQPLAVATLLAAVSLFGWWRRSVPGALPLVVASLLGVLWLLGMALRADSVTGASRFAWFRVQAALQLPVVSATTCFALEYARPGRSLSRRNLSLLSVAPILVLIAILIHDSRFVWSEVQLQPDGAIALHHTAAGLLAIAYGFVLVLVGVVSFTGLFIRSPQHRWPMLMVLIAEAAGPGVYLLDPTRHPAIAWLDPATTGMALTWTAYAIALFGFGSPNPVPMALRCAVEQMRPGMLVLGTGWQVVGVNPAAAAILGVSAGRVLGKTLYEVLPALPAETGWATTEPTATEIVVGAGPHARHYALDLFPLRDGRDVVAGHLLLLHDLTDRRCVEAHVREEQQTIEAARQRERLSRELNDSVAQALAFVTLQGHAVRRLLARGEIAAADEHVARLLEAAGEADTAIRESILGQRVGLSEQRLLATVATYLYQYELRYGIHTEMSGADTLDDEALEPAVEAQLLRVIQEALTNVRKHARARNVWVAFTVDSGWLRVKVEDNGCGFDKSRVLGEYGGRVGLHVMQERLERIGGSLAVRSEPGEGTQVTVTVPLRPGHGHHPGSEGGTDSSASA